MPPLRPLPRLNLLRSPLRRLYHSYDHAPPPSPYTPTETAILSSALTHVRTHGFTPTALSLGARSAGYLDITPTIFPRGVFDLVLFHLVTSRLSLKEHASASEGLGTTARVQALVKARLEANAPVQERMLEMFTLMSLAGNIPAATAELGRLVDEVWWCAGDRVADMSWYTKRGLLAGVYASTELYMARDTSEGFEQTWRFLDRRLKDVMVVGRRAGKVGEYLGFTGRAVANLLSSKGVRGF